MKPSQDPSSKPATRPTPNLERVRVVTVALELLNEVGFEGLTLRRLADKLGVKAAALYWHFENKQDLIDQLAIRIIEDEFKKDSGEERPRISWEELLMNMGHGIRQGLMRYRDGALIIANADLTKGQGFKGRHLMIERLLDEGFTLQQALYAMFVVGRYTLGCVFEEQADPRSREEVSRDYQSHNREMFKDHPRILNEFSKIDVHPFLDSDKSYDQGLRI
ncbi:MAG TPA: TetR/AcrR family transcriptional regulator C-terminal domain-containing protein, partial [Candidatus Saccharimonadales bacterium]|nr:TetR/AcrR family transcriptional regulator C-terminal domain-containing protein [Candidatus Saccharimonadales bacterium]